MERAPPAATTKTPAKIATSSVTVPSIRRNRGLSGNSPSTIPNHCAVTKK